MEIFAEHNIIRKTEKYFDRYDFIMTKELYKERELKNHHFKVYPGVGHEITDEMIQDYMEFLND